ncbi:MAG: 3-ketoacyl-ACP reductase [Chloroflexi bacterium]|nr:3-ketoacyl-ACP reductase [Chloroflexota bacterium]
MHKVAMVTGASRGIGRGIALALAERGWSVAMNYHSNAAAAEDALREVQSLGATGIIVQADIAQAAARERLVTQTLERFGRIDLLVNNAGMAPRQRMDILEVSESSYDEVLATNLKGPFFLTQRVAQVMLSLASEGTPSPTPTPQPGIINIGSISAYTSSINRAEYCLSKAGMAMMTALYADRLAGAGINVYEIRPGIIDTDMTSVAKTKYDKLIAEGLTPIRRWGSPGDVARAVVAIAEGYFPLSTGEVINVDGGFHLRRL